MAAFLRLTPRTGGPIAGEWPKESRQGATGPAHAFLTGSIDGETGKGRMRVEGRSDGTWVAKRKE